MAVFGIKEFDWMREYHQEKSEVKRLLQEYSKTNAAEVLSREDMLKVGEQIWCELAPADKKNSFYDQENVKKEKAFIAKARKSALAAKEKISDSHRSIEYCLVWEEQDTQQALQKHASSTYSTNGRAAYFYAAGMETAGEARIRMIDSAERIDAPWLVTLRRAQVRMDWISAHRDEITNRMVITARSNYYNEAISLFKTLRTGRTKIIAAASIAKLEAWHKEWTSAMGSIGQREPNTQAAGGETGTLRVPRWLQYGVIGCLGIMVLMAVMSKVGEVSGGDMPTAGEMSDGDVGSNFSEEEQLKANFYVTEDGVLSAIYDIGDNAIVIPEEVNGIKITRVEDLNITCLEGVALEELTLPEGVETIGYGFFWNSHNQSTTLKKLVLPSTLKNIEARAFTGCSSLEEIVVPDEMELEYVGTEVFVGTKWYTLQHMETGYVALGNALLVADPFSDTVTIPEGIVTIGCNVFANNQDITELYLPDGLKYINTGGFSQCSNMTSVSFPDSIKEIAEAGFLHCSSLEDITFRGAVDNLVIGRSAFEGCNYKNIDFPEGLSEIGERAFFGTAQMTSITIPGSVKWIGGNAFYVSVFDGTKRMEKIEIKEGVEQIDGGAFIGIYPEELILPDNLKEIHSGAFDHFADMRTEDGFYIEDGVLFGYDGESKNVVIPDGVKMIAGGAFNESDIISVVCPDSVVSIGYQAFRWCWQLQKVTLSENLRYIGAEAFNGAGLGFISFPNSLTTIGDRAFEGCRSLTILRGGENVTEVGEYVFDYTGISAEVQKEWELKNGDAEE